MFWCFLGGVFIGIIVSAICFVFAVKDAIDELEGNKK